MSHVRDVPFISYVYIQLGFTFTIYIDNNRNSCDIADNGTRTIIKRYLRVCPMSVMSHLIHMFKFSWVIDIYIIYPSIVIPVTTRTTRHDRMNYEMGGSGDMNSIDFIQFIC